MGPGKLVGPSRLVCLREALRHLLIAVKPDVVLYEGYAMAAKGRVFHIGELGGVLKTLMYEMGITVVEVPPLTLKTVVTGSGNPGAKARYRNAKKPGKAAMVDAVRERYGFHVPQDDEADAFALLMLGEHHYGLTQPPAAIGKSAYALEKLAGDITVSVGRQLQMIAKKTR